MKMKIIQDKSYRIANFILAIIIFTFGLMYALIMPPFSGPDEINHYNSVVRVYQGDGWPLPYEAQILKSTQIARIESGLQNSKVIPQSSIVSPNNRSSFLKDSNETTMVIDNMVQHPPLYYYLSAITLKIFRPFIERWDHALFLMRMFSSLLIACSVIFISKTIRNVGVSSSIALVASTSILAVSMFLMQTGFVSNDNLLILATSGCFYFLIQKWPHQLNIFHPSIFAGVFLGIAFLTKGFALLLIPFVIILSYIANQDQNKRNWFRISLPVLIGLLLGGWWWVRNLILLGKIQPSVYGSFQHNGVMSEKYDLIYFIGAFFNRLNSTFWTRSAKVEIAMPNILSDIAGILLFIAVVTVIFLSKKRLLFSVIIAYVLLIVAVLFVRSNYLFYYFGTSTRGIQGRYLYSAIIFLPLTLSLLLNLTKPTMLKYSRLIVLFFISMAWVSVIWYFYKIYSFNEVNNINFLNAPSYFSGISDYFYIIIIIINILMTILFLKYLKLVSKE